MSFAAPWGLLGLLALPAIIVIHMYHRRFPPLAVAGLHLWTSETKQNLEGRKRETLPITASLILELLAALLITAALSRPRFGTLSDAVHLVAVLDNSASMMARPGKDAATFRNAAITELDTRFESLPRGSVVTLILTGTRPTMLAGPAVPWADAKQKLTTWKPGATRHSFEPAWDLGLQLVEKTGELLFVTDHMPDEKETPAKMAVVSVGRRLENVAINAARWTFDSSSGKGKVFLRVQNLGRADAKFEIRGSKGETVVFRRDVSLPAGGATSLETEVQGGLGRLSIDLHSADDHLDIDNHTDLIEPQVRTVHAAITLPKGEAPRLIRKVLDVLPDVQFGDPESADLLFAPGGVLPAANSRQWWFGVGPISREEDDVEKAKDLGGPFLLEKRHSLLEGIVLGGIVWGGVQPIEWDVTPLVSSGKSILLARLNGTRTVAYLLNINLDRSNLGESPDWPILLTNLVEQRRENLPGLQRWNYKLGEDVRFRFTEDESAIDSADAKPLALVHAEKSKPIARTSVIEIPSPDDPGLYEIRDGETLVGNFAVNFHDAEESDLKYLLPGRREPQVETTVSQIGIDNPYNWLVLLALVLILAAVLSDWWVLRGGSRG